MPSVATPYFARDGVGTQASAITVKPHYFQMSRTVFEVTPSTTIVARLDKSTQKAWKKDTGTRKT